MRTGDVAKDKALRKTTKTVGASAQPRQAKTNSAARRHHDANVDNILGSAASLFAEKSFGLASIREIAARANISFPRIYYYLRNKEELLYLISRRAFEQLVSLAESRISETDDPEERLRLFIRSHLEYHMSNLAEMKVLVREADSLGGRHGVEIARLKREYSRLCRRLLENYAIHRNKALDREHARILTSLLFGAMNWFYTWYEPARDYEQRGRIFDECFRMVAGSLTAR
jgi:TetR/AcrR family transcriptional regulator, cholesterol catabolism regulator